MSALDLTEPLVEAPPPSGQPTAATEETYRRYRLGVVFWLAAAWLVAIVLAAIFAGVLPLKNPKQTFPGLSREGPNATHWFGVDNIGQDVFSRTIYGARRSLTVAFAYGESPIETPAVPL